MSESIKKTYKIAYPVKGALGHYTIVSRGLN